MNASSRQPGNAALSLLCSLEKPGRLLAAMFPQLFIRLGKGFFPFRELMNKEEDKRARRILLLAYHRYMQDRGFFIGEGAHIPSPPVFPHGMHSVYISNGASIGKGCVIFPNAVIGSNTLRDSRRTGAPVIGEQCYIGAGASIVGGITIGSSCRIGANTTVFEDIPDSCVVVSEKPRIIRKQGLDNTWEPFPS